MHCCRIVVKKAGKKGVIYQAVLSFCNFFFFFLKQELYYCVLAGMHCQVHLVYTETDMRKKDISRGQLSKPTMGFGKREIMLFSKRDTVFTCNKEFTG